MKLMIYQVDAFTDQLFHGNPAAVCPLGKEWLPDTIMQDIATENNLAETAFYIFNDNHYSIRWFTPAVEVDLCGHATLATAHVLFNHENYGKDSISFESKSGLLSVSKKEKLLSLNFPTDKIIPIENLGSFSLCFDNKPIEVYKGLSDYLCIFETEKQIQSMKPNFYQIGKLDSRGVIISAPGETVDFVSRCFFPQLGINEDPVTGSAHTTLVPYWAKKLKKDSFSAKQLSRRIGYLSCAHLGDRTEISGNAITFFIAEAEIPYQQGR